MKIAMFPGAFKPPHVGHYTLLKKILPNVDDIYVIISPKSRVINSNREVDARQSQQIWKTYLNNSKLSNSNKNKVHLSISKKSPILSAYSLISDKLKNKKLKATDTVYLIKSSKDIANKRFDMFNRLKVNIVNQTLPKFKTISSTNMRKAIQNNDYKTFTVFLPTVLTEKEKKDIWKNLSGR